jgi:hypothetical protein
MTPDGFVTDQPLPSFLSADKTKLQDVGIIWDAAAISSRALQMSILAATAALIGLVALEVEHPLTRFPKFTASPSDMSTGQRDTSPSTPPIRSSADAEIPALITTGVPARNEIAAAPQPASRIQRENNEPRPGVLFMQFQAWAARQATRTEVELVPPEQDAPAPIMTEGAPTPVQPLQKHRKAKAAQNAQAEIPHIPMPRARLQWGQNVRLEGRPVQDLRSQDLAMLDALPPPFLQSLGSYQ